MNVTFIGMPGSGKSFIGKMLAENLQCEFVDIDSKLEQKFKLPLQEILDTLGETEFVQAEARAVLSEDMNSGQKVVAPGGSVIYDEEVMQFLQDHSLIIFVEIPLVVIEARIQAGSRGIAWGNAKSLEELWQERKSLYEKYADRHIDGTKSAADLVEELTWDGELWQDRTGE
jgi:shikimate kinase